MNSVKLAVLGLLAVCLILPACQESSPVETKGTDVPATGAAFAKGGGAPVFRRQINEDIAVAFTAEFGDHSARWIGVHAFRGGRGPNASGSLFIQGGECLFETGECSSFWGEGEIPGSDMTGSFSRGEFAVHTDLRTNPDFYLEGAEPGIVSVRWKRVGDGLLEGRFTGVQEFRWGNSLSRFAGTFRESSADATGEVLGVSIDQDWSDRWRYIATAKGATMEFYVDVSN